MSVIKGYPLSTSSPNDAQVITCTKDTVAAKIGLNVVALGSVVPANWDSATLSYTGSNLTGVVFKNGATTIRTVTLGYTGSNLTSVTLT